MDKKYWYIFLTVCSCILFYFLLTNFQLVSYALSRFFSIISPILYGFAIAYLLWPLTRMWDRILKKAFPKMKKRMLRAVSLTITYLIVVFVLSAIVLIIVPQTAESVSTLVSNISSYTKNFASFIDRYATRLGGIFQNNEFFGTAISTALSGLEDLVSDAASGLVALFPNVLNILAEFTTVIGYVVFGLFLSVYMLFDKENLVARIKKTVYAFCKEERARKTVLFFRKTNETVGSFINGKILSSFAVAVCSFVLFLIFDIEFPGLLALIIGVTDIIPIFGPIIGAVPCGLILLMVEPRQLIPFIIMIVVIQQIEGNIISPKILGHVTGVSGFWVMVALTVGGGLFGVMGMILSVPLFAVLYGVFKQLVNHFLEKKHLAVDTDFYIDFPPHPAEEKAENDEQKGCKKLFFGKNKKKTEKGQ